jgi:hypothetical protein
MLLSNKSKSKNVEIKESAESSNRKLPRHGVFCLLGPGTG